MWSVPAVLGLALVLVLLVLLVVLVGVREAGRALRAGAAVQ